MALCVVALIALGLLGCEEESCNTECYSDWQLSLCESCVDGILLERDCINMWCDDDPTCVDICEDSTTLASCQQCTIDGGDELNCIELWCN